MPTSAVSVCAFGGPSGVSAVMSAPELVQRFGGVIVSGMSRCFGRSAPGQGLSVFDPPCPMVGIVWLILEAH